MTFWDNSRSLCIVIDWGILKTRHHNLAHSEIVKLMVLNGLGFIGHRLYLFPEFFDDIALCRLIGRDIIKASLNDDVFDRTLDAVAEYGPTEMFYDLGVIRSRSRMDNLKAEPIITIIFR
jgi:transposase